jgi:hypothetical protein
VPANPSGGSRWRLPVSPGGWPSPPAKTFASVLSSLVADRIGEAEDHRPEPVVVRLRMVVKRGDEYELAERGAGSLERAPVYQNRRPGKRFNRLQGETLLFSVFTGGEGFELAPDDCVWAAACDVAAADQMGVRELRALNDSLAIVLAARAGVLVRREELPHPDGLVR